MSILDRLLNRSEKPKENVEKIISSFPSRNQFSFLTNSGNADFEITDDFKGYEKAYHDQVWVQRCINLLASSVATVPVKLIREKDGKKEEVKDHPILTLLDDVNPLNMNASDLWKSTIIDLKIYGNCYWYLGNKRLKEPKEIYRLNPSFVEIVPSGKIGEYIQKYTYATNNKDYPKVDYSTEDIIHFKYSNPSDEFYGLSPLSSIRNAISTALYVESWNKYYFKNATRLEGILSILGGDMDEGDKKALKKDLESHFKGVKKAHQTPVVMNDMKYIPISTIPKDAEWNQLSLWCREAICSALGVPPILIVASDASSYATAYEQKKSLWHETLLPEISYLYEVLKWTLIPQFEDHEGLTLEPDYRNVYALQEEISNIHSRIFQSVGVPYLTREEGRVATGYPAQWEGELFEPLNMASQGDIKGLADNQYPQNPKGGADQTKIPPTENPPKAVYPTKRK